MGDQDHPLSTSILVMLTLLVINEVILNFFNKQFLKYPSLGKFLNNTILTTFLGILAGITLRVFGKNFIIDEYQGGFSDFFIIILLPPILFESAINMERALFFKNIGSILAFAIIGTLISTITTSFLTYAVGYTGLVTSLSFKASFAFGALISATDPVAVLGLFRDINADKTLYILIYGESILNDAMAIIMYQISVESKTDTFVSAIEEFLIVFIVSIAIGLFIGFSCAYILKIKQELTVETEHIEVSVTVIIPWVSYLLADSVGYSGIVSIVFCGIAMARYALPNLSESGKALLNKFYHLLAYNFENIVFLFIGLGMVGFDLAFKEMGIGLCICALLIITFARYLNIRGVSYLLNISRSDNHIQIQHQYAFWFSGLRGAMAYALALNSVDKFSIDGIGKIILTITMVIVTVNIFIQGALLRPVMDYLDIRQKELSPHGSEDEIRITQSRGLFTRFKDCIQTIDIKLLQELLIKKRDQSPVIRSPIIMRSSDRIKKDDNQENKQQEERIEEKIGQEMNQLKQDEKSQ